jgi:hypothetical protein
METVVPIYFQQTKLASFRRQLNLYGFRRISHGPDKGSYYNEFFLRGRSFLAKRIVRKRVTGNRAKRVLYPGNEPDFYKMTFLENVAQGQNEPALSSTSERFGPKKPTMPISTHSTEFHQTTKGKEINPTSCRFPGTSAQKIPSKEKNSRRKFSIDSCFKIDQSLHDEWDLDAFSLEDNIFHDCMKDDSSQEEDIWSLSFKNCTFLSTQGLANYIAPTYQVT